MPRPESLDRRHPLSTVLSDETTRHQLSVETKNLRFPLLQCSVNDWATFSYPNKNTVPYQLEVTCLNSDIDLEVLSPTQFKVKPQIEGVYHLITKAYFDNGKRTEVRPLTVEARHTSPRVWLNTSSIEITPFSGEKTVSIFIQPPTSNECPQVLATFGKGVDSHFAAISITQAELFTAPKSPNTLPIFKASITLKNCQPGNKTLDITILGNAWETHTELSLNSRLSHSPKAVETVATHQAQPT